LIILVVSTSLVQVHALLVGSLLFWISRNAAASYFIMISQDFLLPIGLFLGSLPTTLMIFQGDKVVKWNNTMEDIQQSVMITALKSNNG
jgi:hypothetical protein